MPPTGSTADVPSLGGQNVAVIHDRLRAAILSGELHPRPDDPSVCPQCSWRALCRAPHLN